MRAAMLGALGVLAIASSARADEPAAAPAAPSATPYLAWGGALTGLGALNLATSPICGTGLVVTQLRTACWATSLAAGGVLASVGVPLLVVGIRRRAAAPPVVVSPVVGGAMVSWSQAW